MPRTTRSQPALSNDVQHSFAQNMIEVLSLNGTDGQTIADPLWQGYRPPKAQDEPAKSQPVTPVPLIFLGVERFGSCLALSMIEQVMVTRESFKASRGVYFPVLGIADGYGSVSPAQRMPYYTAVATGLSNDTLGAVVTDLRSGSTLVGSGVKDTADVVATGGQPGCVVLDVCDNKKAHARVLPGMLKAAQLGYFGAVMGRVPEKHLEAMQKAFGDRLLIQPLGAPASSAPPPSAPAASKRATPSTTSTTPGAANGHAPAPASDCPTPLPGPAPVAGPPGGQAVVTGVAAAAAPPSRAATGDVKSGKSAASPAGEDLDLDVDSPPGDAVAAAARSALQRVSDWQRGHPHAARVAEGIAAGAVGGGGPAGAAAEACGCGCEADSVDLQAHAAALMGTAASSPKEAVAQVAAGSVQMALAVASILFTAAPREPEVAQRLMSAGLLPAVQSQLRAAKAERQYRKWTAALGVMGALCLFEGPAGAALRSTWLQAGAAGEFMAGAACHDATTKQQAEGFIKMLRQQGRWLRPCSGCGVSEVDQDTFKYCAKCMQVCYCGRECQVRHWGAGGHKTACKALAAL